MHNVYTDYRYVGRVHITRTVRVCAQTTTTSTTTTTTQIDRQINTHTHINKHGTSKGDCEAKQTTTTTKEERKERRKDTGTPTTKITHCLKT